MNNHIGRTLLLIILTFYSLMSPASGVSKYSTLIREVRGWSQRRSLPWATPCSNDMKTTRLSLCICSFAHAQTTI